MHSSSPQADPVHRNIAIARFIFQSSIKSLNGVIYKPIFTGRLHTHLLASEKESHPGCTRFAS
jgi:hypothetical protein